MRAKKQTNNPTNNDNNETRRAPRDEAEIQGNDDRDVRRDAVYRTAGDAEVADTRTVEKLRQPITRRSTRSGRGTLDSGHPAMTRGFERQTTATGSSNVTERDIDQE
jgi:hypothetical protein